MALNKPGTRVEFYRKGADKYIAVLSGVGAIPREGGLINIRGKTWRVTGITWAIDRSDSVTDSELRANIELVPVAATKGDVG